MDSVLTWLIALVLIVAMFWLLSIDYKRKQSRTEEEYEEEVRSGQITGRAMAKAGFLEIEKMFKPSLQAAIEYVEDEKQGQTKAQEEGDDERKT
jgi:hypothetical protein